MSGLSKARVIVAGGGALGTSIALQLAQAGAQVVLADPNAAEDSASGVAAGMLAPAMEALLDPEAAMPFAVLQAARDLWPAFAERLHGDIGLQRAGAVWVDLPGAAPRGESLIEGLGLMGAHLAPSPSERQGAALFTPDDWRLAPSLALPALRHAFLAAGGELVVARVEEFEAGQARLSDGSRRPADRLVAATGSEGGMLAPELRRLVPIKGQILKFPDFKPPADTPAIRCAEGYAVGGRDGLYVGATMEAGLRDRIVDPAVVARLHALAARFYPQTEAMTPVARAGVRAASPGGPPMIGLSAAASVLVAAGARRNGWLVAPMAAQIITALIAERDPGPHATLFDPQAMTRAAPA